MSDLSPNEPLKILAFSDVFLPGYKGGGPIKTIKNLIEQTDKEISFQLVTNDRDLGDSAPYSSIVCGEWNQVGNASVFYAKPGSRGYKQIAHILREKNYDVIYLNSFFSPRFSFYPLLLAKFLKKKIVLGPRGELSRGALKIKPIKKRIFIAAFKLLKLQNGVTFQASSDFELRDISQTLGPKVDIRIAEDIGSKDFAEPSHERQSNTLRAVFVSRISPIKNLLMALESTRNIKRPFIYHVYGPIEDISYWEQCQRVIETLPTHITIEYKGPLNPADVVATMSKYDVFYLPTKGENYGHVIAEALCAALPLVISDTTPWRNLKEQGIGWDLPLGSPDEFSAALNCLSEMPEKEYKDMRKRVLLWAKEKFTQRDAIESNIALFRHAHKKKI